MWLLSDILYHINMCQNNVSFMSQQYKFQGHGYKSWKKKEPEVLYPVENAKTEHQFPCTMWDQMNWFCRKVLTGLEDFSLKWEKSSRGVQMAMILSLNSVSVKTAVNSIVAAEIK